MPVILIFQPALGAVAHDDDAKRVLAGHKVRRQIEARGQLAVLRETDKPAVEPHRAGRFGAHEFQRNLPLPPIPGQLEGAPIAAGRVLRRQMGRAVQGFAPLMGSHRGLPFLCKGVGHIGVDGFSVALQLPVAGHNNTTPPGGFVQPSFGHCFGARIELEPPLAVEAQRVTAGLAIAGLCLGLVLVGAQRRMGGQAVGMAFQPLVPWRFAVFHIDASSVGGCFSQSAWEQAKQRAAMAGCAPR